jgi:threonyl-tRNA synthetase
LIENYAGAFPVWLTPVQIKILPITDKHADYAKKLYDKFFSLGFRAEVDDRSEKTGKKIRDAQVKKIPYMIVIGDKEMETGVLPIRKYGSKDSVEMSTDDFISYVQNKIATRDAEY